MKKKLFFTILIICLFAIVTVVAFAQPSQSIQWEYTYVKVRNGLEWDNIAKGRMDQLGKEGWELVTTIYNGHSNNHELIFKRRLP